MRHAARAPAASDRLLYSACPRTDREHRGWGGPAIARGGRNGRPV